MSNYAFEMGKREGEIEFIEKIFRGVYVNPRHIIKIWLPSCIDTEKGAQTAFSFEILLEGYAYSTESWEYEDFDECEKDRDHLVRIVHSCK